jgi:hypothetical protein
MEIFKNPCNQIAVTKSFLVPFDRFANNIISCTKQPQCKITGDNKIIFRDKQLALISFNKMTGKDIKVIVAYKTSISSYMCIIKRK